MQYAVVERGNYGREISRTVVESMDEARQHVDRWIRGYACGEHKDPTFPADLPFFIVPEMTGAYLETGTTEFRGIYIFAA